LFLSVCMNDVSGDLALIGHNLQLKLAPFGPAYFCAKPDVIHVGLLIQV
jgi:hypothetical protein